jgi:thioesterase domain-containing protein
MASSYLKEIQVIQPEGPYSLGGAGVGGIIAFEMAQQLTSQGKSVGTLVLMDTVLPRPFQSGTYSSGPVGSLRYYVRRVTSHVEKREVMKTTRESLREEYGRLTHNMPGVPNYEVWAQTQKAADNYIPRVYPGRCVLLVPEERSGFPADPRARIDPWRNFATGKFIAHVIPGQHLGIFKEPYVRVLAQKLKQCLDEASENSS